MIFAISCLIFIPYQNKTNLFPWDALIKWNQYERKYNGSNYQDGNSQVLESYIDGSDLLDTLPDSIEDDSYKFLTKSKGTLMLHLLLTMKPNSKEKNEEFIDRLEKTAQQVIETAIINGETDVVETLKLLADYMNVPPYKC